MSSLAHALRFVTLLVVATLGCSDEPLPIQYETEHLRIGTDLDHPLCRGDLLAYERIIAKVEDEFDIEMDGVATVYVWDDDTWLTGPHEYCSPNSAGCTHHRPLSIYTGFPSLEHELVHLAMGSTRAPAFFEESIADIYGGRQSRFGETAPSDNEGTSAETMDRGTGPHFVRWLLERWGAEKLSKLVYSSRSANNFDNFADVYGMSIESAEQIYFDDAPYGYPSFYQCEAPFLEPTSPAPTWTAEFGLDCENDDLTRVYGIGLTTSRTFEIPSAGYYSVRVDGDWFEVYRCSPSRIDEVVPNNAWFEDVPAHHEGYPSGASGLYIEPTTQALYFEAGAHQISVGRIGYSNSSVRLAIWPSSGPTPALPE